MTDGVVSLLRRQIISGELSPGRKITECELATALGVSRTPVREAFRLLQGEDLVEKRPSGGFSVTGIHLSDVVETYKVRALLEGLMVRDATDRLTNADSTALRALVDQMRGLQSDKEAVVRVGRRFHGVIHGIATNRWARSALDQMHGRIDRYRARAAVGAGPSDESMREHAAILAAMERGAATEAETLMRRHIDRQAGSDIAVIAGSLAAVGDDHLRT
jgi:DNA-binding GntR family transcriptional regulator